MVGLEMITYIKCSDSVEMVGIHSDKDSILQWHAAVGGEMYKFTMYTVYTDKYLHYINVIPAFLCKQYFKCVYMDHCLHLYLTCVVMLLKYYGKFYLMGSYVFI